MNKKLALILTFSILALLANSQPVANKLGIENNFKNDYREEWSAAWITNPDIYLSEFAVIHFRKSFDLYKKPESFIVHVSADNRYRLFVN
ncbi:MAG: alpha-L-rhamnosidase, partial [Bacteroidota bacterium]